MIDWISVLLCKTLIIATEKFKDNAPYLKFVMLQSIQVPLFVLKF